MHLVKYLSASDENQLTVIEKKQERCKEVSNVSDATILNEDGSKPEVLRKAEASQADMLLVATSDDRANLAIARQCKQEFGVPRIIAVANSPRNKNRSDRSIWTGRKPATDRLLGDMDSRNHHPAQMARRRPSPSNRAAPSWWTDYDRR